MTYQTIADPIERQKSIKQSKPLNFSAHVEKNMQERKLSNCNSPKKKLVSSGIQLNKDCYDNILLRLLNSLPEKKVITSDVNFELKKNKTDITIEEKKYFYVNLCEFDEHKLDVYHNKAWALPQNCCKGIDILLIGNTTKRLLEKLIALQHIFHFDIYHVASFYQAYLLYKKIKKTLKCYICQFFNIVIIDESIDTGEKTQKLKLFKNTFESRLSISKSLLHNSEIFAIIDTVLKRDSFIQTFKNIGITEFLYMVTNEEEKRSLETLRLLIKNMIKPQR